jgi:hypothetical protein
VFAYDQLVSGARGAGLLVALAIVVSGAIYRRIKHRR